MKLPQVRNIVVMPHARDIPSRPRYVLKTACPTLTDRLSLMGARPFLFVRSKKNACTLETPQHTEKIHTDPFLLLQEVLDTYKNVSPHMPMPFSGGAFVALSYDLKDVVEELPSRAHDDLDLPDMIAVLCKEYWVIDEISGDVTKIEIQTDVDEDFSPSSHFSTTSFSSPASNFTRDAFMHAVRKTIAHICEGNIYQANVAQRFQVKGSTDLFSLFQTLCKTNPAPMMGYLEFPECTIISTSPERFLKRCGTQVETSPIKGTRRRGKTPLEDETLRKQLWESPKENAELSMIVDLMRNDLGKMALPGSVVVSDPKRIATYANVFHLVATVVAHVDVTVSPLHLIRSCFPGGSITGCPKLRAMEIIETLEPVKRSFYTGSIGYIGFDGNFDLNIAIRTFIATRDTLSFSLGSGIVADSNPEEEYLETLYKGASMFEAIREVTR